MHRHLQRGSSSQDLASMVVSREMLSGERERMAREDKRRRLAQTVAIEGKRTFSQSCKEKRQKCPGICHVSGIASCKQA